MLGLDHELIGLGLTILVEKCEVRHAVGDDTADAGREEAAFPIQSRPG